MNLYVNIILQVARFFAVSSNREDCLSYKIDELLRQNDGNGPKKTKLKQLCRTRWVERHAVFETFSGAV